MQGSMFFVIVMTGQRRVDPCAVRYLIDWIKLISDSCVIGAMVDGNVCRSAVNDGSCSPWVMCSCSVVSGNQIRDSHVARLLRNSRKY